MGYCLGADYFLYSVLNFNRVETCFIFRIRFNVICLRRLYYRVVVECENKDRSKFFFSLGPGALMLIYYKIDLQKANILFY